MPIFSVDSDGVLTATQTTQAHAATIQSDTAIMLGLLTQLQGTWTGGASAAFQQIVENWRILQRQVDEQLAAITTALAAAGRQYADTELAAAGLFRT